MPNLWHQIEKASDMGRAYPLLGIGFVLLVALLLYLLPEQKARMRTALILFGLSILGLIFAGTLLQAGFDERGHLYLGVRFTALLVESIALVNVASVVLFSGILKAARLQPPQIAQDLIIAFAYLAIAIGLLAESGVDLRGIVATSAVLTAVIGFSLQDALGNIMGGMALQMERTIRVGDWIRIDDLEGRVREIRWRQTSLETRNWDVVVIPNSALMKSRVTLLGRRSATATQRRQWVYFHVDLSHAPTKVIETVENALRGEPIPCVADVPTAHCLLTEVKNGDGTYAVRYWLTDLSKPDPTDSLVRTRIYAALRRSNIPLSIPAQAVILTDAKADRERVETEELRHRVDALQSLHFFHPLSEDERHELAARLVNAPFVKGEAMTRQGAQANWLYMIIEGEAEVRVTVDGFTKKVATLRDGDYFGEMGLMTGEPRTATVVALTDIRCYRLGKEAFEGIMRRRPELAEQISGTLAQRRVELEMIKSEMGKEAVGDQMAKTQTALLRRIRDFFGLADRAA